MNTLQSIDGPFELPTPLGPFDRLAQRSQEDAKAVALAFATSHQMTDVWAALRFHRRMSGADLTGYLIGCLFAEWQTGHDRDMSDLAVSELRELAHEWLEGK